MGGRGCRSRDIVHDIAAGAVRAALKEQDETISVQDACRRRPLRGGVGVAEQGVRCVGGEPEGVVSKWRCSPQGHAAHPRQPVVVMTPDYRNFGIIKLVLNQTGTLFTSLRRWRGFVIVHRGQLPRTLREGRLPRKLSETSCFKSSAVPGATTPLPPRIMLTNAGDESETLAALSDLPRRSRSWMGRPTPTTTG